VSRQDQLNPPPIDTSSEGSTAEEYRLQIDLRLKIDEIVELEAELLNATGYRQPGRGELCRLAGKIYDARRMRERILDQRLFGEPAWDMLLALYALPSRGEMLRPSYLAFAANVPSATGIRWERILTKRGLIERGPRELAPRRQFVRLTEEGRSLMERYLTRLYFSKTPIPLFPERAGG
jgi:DNA-binding MarR family transcriptional regulator